MTEKTPLLLAIVELGGYPNFTPLYRQAGYQVEMLASMRKALAAVKRRRPAVVVAEFNYQPDFRDRTSNLESLLATAQHLPETRVIVFYERENLERLEKLRQRFPFFHGLPYPVEVEQLRALVGGPDNPL